MISRGAGELARQALAWGVETSWHDVRGERHDVPAEALEAVLAALGAAPGAAPPADAAPLVVGPADTLPVGGVLQAEDGSETAVAAGMPAASLPLGYHRLVGAGGASRPLIVGPGRCHLPEGLHTWGWAVQLYSLHSQRSWGIGDFGDLGAIAGWARGLGAGLLLLSPLHYSAPLPPVEPSPYSPGSRRFRDPIYLCVPDVPGVADVPGAAPGPVGDRIDRDAVLRHKLDALGGIWEAQGDRQPPEFVAWRAAQGPDLEAFGAWCALAEVHGTAWLEWPTELRDRHSAAVAREHARLRHRADFHVWLQWLVDVQLHAAAARLPLLHDVAIGVDPGGVDAWLQPGTLAGGVHVGAPPDLFNTAGQDWGIAPFDPWALRREAYAPFSAVLRACLRGAAGLRVDHVMGLSRLFWIPEGATPAEGAYVRYPMRDLFEVLALESVRAGGIVVGEDLGTVEPAVRQEMAARDVLSYRLLWFEPEPPRAFPRTALAAVTTHDLPTVAGLWSGADVRDQQAAGLSPAVEEHRRLREHLRSLRRLHDGASVEEAVLAAYSALAEAPSAVLLATLEDLLLVERRPNMPGTTADHWPSWSMPLPAGVEEIVACPRAEAIARLLRRGG